jgi:hypothetical protein
MHKFISGLGLAVLMFALLAHISRGQSASTNLKSIEIKQGDILNLDVTVEKAPNVDGRIFVDAGPDGGPAEITLRCNLDRDSTKCQAGERLPLDAKVGKWVVTKISFQPLAPAPPKELTKHGELSFQVFARRDVFLPESATISDIK